MKLVCPLVLLLVPLLARCTELGRPVDCSEIHQQDMHKHSHVYTIYPLGERSGVQAYCDMDREGGGWTVFQRRVDGNLNFYRPWDQYKIGFGDAKGEYWLGLDNLHYLSSKKKQELLVYMEDFEGNNASARYSSFSVAPECDGYKLGVSGFTDGGAGDALTYHNAMLFSTFDRDQDTAGYNCAKKFLGAFWYKSCHHANPGGVYRWGADGTLHAVGASWYHWKKTKDYSLKTYVLMIRPAQQ